MTLNILIFLILLNIFVHIHLIIVQLFQVEIPNDSKLKTINESAFSYTSIKNIKIPSSVTLIGEYTFLSCLQLEIIEIPNDSKLQTIGKDAFSFSKIKSIEIPSSATLIVINAFKYCKNLQIIEIDNEEMISICQTAFENCENAFLMIPFHNL